MRWIDYENKLPIDDDIPGWTPWTQEKWEAWLEKSEALKKELADLDAAGRRSDRNKLIDDNAAHWGKLKIGCWPCPGKNAGFLTPLTCMRTMMLSTFAQKRKRRT